MKCPKCGGNAELSNWGSYIDPDYADFHVECEKCGYHSMGSTEPQKAKEMFEKGMGTYYTNEGWLRTATTEQLAEFLFRIAYMCSYCGDESHSSQEKMQQCHFGKCGCQRKDWVESLKQPHTPKE